MYEPSRAVRVYRPPLVLVLDTVTAIPALLTAPRAADVPDWLAAEGLHLGDKIAVRVHAAVRTTSGLWMARVSLTAPLAGRDVKIDTWVDAHAVRAAGHRRERHQPRH